MMISWSLLLFSCWFGWFDVDFVEVGEICKNGVKNRIWDALKMNGGCVYVAVIYHLSQTRI